MRIIKNKYIISIFFTALMLTSFTSFGTNNVSASTVLEDIYEENDDFWSANETGPGYFPNLCQGDEDWFNVSIGVNEVIKVSLYFDGSQNDIELELYDNSQMILDSSYGIDSYESVAWLSDAPQSVYIRIYGYDNSEKYDMNIEIVPKGAYDDDYEENDDFASASEINPNYFHSLVNNDTDIYKIYFDSDFSINIFNTTFLWAELRDYNNNWVADFSVIDSHLVLDWFPPYQGDYYIFVNGPNLGDFYDMDIWITDDWAEQNDYLYEATHLDFGYHDNLIQKDVDYYEVWLETNDLLEIKLFYDTGYTWMSLELYDENENFLTSGNLDGDHLYLNWTNSDYGRSIYINVSGPDNGDWYYIETILNGQVGGDPFEPNNDWNSAYYLEPGIYNQLFSFDHDYYKFHLNEGDKGIITVKCNYNVPLFLEEISNNDGSTLNSDSSTDDGVLDVIINADHDYDAIFVVKGDDTGEWYNLEISIEYNKSSNDNSGDNSDDNSNNPFENFDLSSIPGFPIELFVTISMISAISVIIFIKRKKT